MNQCHHVAIIKTKNDEGWESWECMNCGVDFTPNEFMTLITGTDTVKGEQHG